MGRADDDRKGKKKIFRVINKGLVKPFSTVFIIHSGSSFRDRELERFITNHKNSEQFFNHFTEVLKSGDPRATFQPFTEAIKVDMYGLRAIGAFKIINTFSLPVGFNFTRFNILSC